MIKGLDTQVGDVSGHFLNAKSIETRHPIHWHFDHTTKIELFTMSQSNPIVQLPEGQQTIVVKVINPVNFGPAILERFMAPPVPGLETFKDSPSFSFLLEHPSGRKLVFDLGIRKDYNNYAPSIVEYLPTTNYDIRVTKNVADILVENGIPAKDIEAVIWRQVAHNMQKEKLEAT